MNPFSSFLAGFAAGWLARSGAASSREAAADMAVFGLDLLDRLKRAAAFERERFEDFMADVRSRADEWRAARSAEERHRTTPTVHVAGSAVASSGHGP